MNNKKDMQIFHMRAIGDYIYFCASKREENCSFYRSKDPRTKAFEEIEGPFPFWDPDMFLDEDGRLYFYWGCSNVTPIYGVELDRETMKPKTKPLVMFDSHEEKYGFERNGDEHVPPKTEEEIVLEGRCRWYNILWGYAPDKLYHSYMVYGKTIQKIGALLQGEPVYVRVDAFNENGITQGNVAKLGAV